MRNETLNELKEIANLFSSENRFAGTDHLKRCQDFVIRFAKDLGLKPIVEEFHTVKNVPVESYLKLNEHEIPVYPSVGSLWGEREAEVVEETEDVKGKIALAKVGGESEREKVRKLKEKGATAVIFYMEDLNSPFIGNVEGEEMIVVSVDREIAQNIKGKKVRLVSKTNRTRLRGRNIYFEIGRGPLVYLIAHLDSKPFVKGAIDNALSVALLLILAKELKGKDFKPYRLRFLITDCEEVGLEGSRRHVKNLGKSIKNVEYVINLDSIGWYNPAVIYKDYSGYNGVTLAEKFSRYLIEQKVDIPFMVGRRGRSDHIPFKEAGCETLFLSSNPFTIRHTFFDGYEAIDWIQTEVWFEVISGFLKNLARL